MNVSEKMHRLRQVLARLVHLLGDRTGALEADERPADEGHRDQERAAEGEVARAGPRTAALGQDAQGVVPVEQQQPGAQPQGPDDLGDDAGAHEDLQRLSADQVDRGAQQQDDEGDDRALPSGRGLDPGDVGDETRRAERHRRHRDDQRPHVGPPGEPAVPGAEQPARPLVDRPLDRPPRHQHRERERHEQLAAEDQQEAPPEARPGRADGQAEDPVQGDDRRDEGEGEGERRPEVELAPERVTFGDFGWGLRHGVLPGVVGLTIASRGGRRKIPAQRRCRATVTTLPVGGLHNASGWIPGAGPIRSAGGRTGCRRP